MRIILALMIIVGLGLGIRDIILKPFSFFNVEYISSSEWDRAPTGLERIPIKSSKPKVLENLSKQISEFNTLDTKIEYATSIVREIMLGSNGNILRTEPENALSRDAAYLNLCTESAKVFAVIMQEANVPTRVVSMTGHTVSEIWNGKKWILIDTFGNVKAYDKSGVPLGIREIIQDFPAAIFKKVVENSNTELPQYFDDGYMTSDENRYRNQNLLLTIAGEDLFTFHTRAYDLKSVVYSALDFRESEVASASQLVMDDYFVGNFGVKLFKRFGF